MDDYDIGEWRMCVRPFADVSQNIILYETSVHTLYKSR